MRKCTSFDTLTVWHTTEILPLTFSFKVGRVSSRQIATCKLSLKDGLWKLWLRGWDTHTHTRPGEFKQCCAQCDYLSFDHAGCSFRGHYIAFSPSHTDNTHKKKKHPGWALPFQWLNRIWSSLSIVLGDPAKAHVASARPASGSWTAVRPPRSPSPLNQERVLKGSPVLLHRAVFETLWLICWDLGI